MNPVVDRRELASCHHHHHHHCDNYFHDDEPYHRSIDRRREYHDVSLTEPLAMTPSDVRMFPTATTATAKSSSSSSPSIPISKMKRSPSELQLQEDEVMAEYRDYCMYVRIVNGMNHARRRSSMPGRVTTLQADDDSLANIVRTRNSHVVLERDVPTQQQQQQQQRQQGYQKHQQQQQNYHYHQEALHQSWPVLPHKSSSSDHDYYYHGPNVDLAPRLLRPDSFGDGFLPPPYMDRPAATEDEGVFVMDL